jgi:hypothetical protein
MMSRWAFGLTNYTVNNLQFIHLLNFVYSHSVYIGCS